MEICKNEQQIVLYEYNNQCGYIFVAENTIFDDKILTHKLEYFENFDGETDVIRYSRVDNSNIVSYYTIRNGIALCGIMKDGEIEWTYIQGLTNFVIVRFKAVKEQGITFVNDDINNLFSKKTYVRIWNR